jgi:hypothetical protein
MMEKKKNFQIVILPGCESAFCVDNIQFINVVAHPKLLYAESLLNQVGVSTAFNRLSACVYPQTRYQ